MFNTVQLWLSKLCSLVINHISLTSCTTIDSCTRPQMSSFMFHVTTFLSVLGLSTQQQQKFGIQYHWTFEKQNAPSNGISRLTIFGHPSWPLRNLAQHPDSSRLWRFAKHLLTYLLTESLKAFSEHICSQDLKLVINSTHNQHLRFHI